MSVVVPTFERPEALAACLDALAGLDYPRGRYEAIVVVDGGTPPTEVVERSGSRLDVTMIGQENAGPAAARNTGAARARGDLLAFTDDDCLPEPGWLRAFAERGLEGDVLAGGRIVNGAPENVYAEASQLVLDFVFDYYCADPNQARFLISCNLCVPAERFREVGGFDERFRISEDRELSDRWRFRGGRVVYVSEAVVRHVRPMTFGGYVRQHFAYGRGAYRYQQERARRGSGRMRSDMSFHGELFGRMRRSLPPTGRRAPALTGLLGVWQAANAAGFLYETTRNRKASRGG